MNGVDRFKCAFFMQSASVSLEHPSHGHTIRERLSSDGTGTTTGENRSDIVGPPGAHKSCLRRDESIT